MILLPMLYSIYPTNTSNSLDIMGFLLIDTPGKPVGELPHVIQHIPGNYTSNSLDIMGFCYKIPRVYPWVNERDGGILYA